MCSADTFKVQPAFGPFTITNPPAGTYYFALGTTLQSDAAWSYAVMALYWPLFFRSTNNGTITITGYHGPGGAVVIPATITGLPVTTIGDNAFVGQPFTSVTIPNSVTNIGAYAFEACSSLTSVTIPDSVTSLGEQAFVSCSVLTNVIIGNGVTGIAESTFEDCERLATVAIGGSVTNIGNLAFFDCTSLTRITIPSSVISIDQAAFSFCRSLRNVTILNGVTNIGYQAFGYCTQLTSVTIPSSVISIGGIAFYDCTSLTSVFFLGNAPTADATVFASDPATVYYLPGTAGWGPTFAGRPTALWLLPNPVILNSAASLGVRSNQFTFTISWATNRPVVVDACTNPANPVWVPLQTNTLTGGMIHFSDAAWNKYPERFYRVRSH